MFIQQKSTVLKTVFISKSSKKKHRFRLVLIMAASFILIMVANVMDYGYILRTQDNVNSVYNDRVVAQDYIYQLSGLFHQKERAIGERESFLGSLNDSILGLMSRFEKTKLTRSESDFFIDLRKNYEELTLLEQKFSHQNYPRISTQNDIQIELMEIRQNLDDLEGVQFTEGAQMTKRSNHALGMNALLSKIELVFLVVIGSISLYMILMGTNFMERVQ